RDYSFIRLLYYLPKLYLNGLDKSFGYITIKNSGEINYLIRLNLLKMTPDILFYKIKFDYKYLKLFLKRLKYLIQCIRELDFSSHLQNNYKQEYNLIESYRYYMMNYSNLIDEKQHQLFDDIQHYLSSPLTLKQCCRFKIRYFSTNSSDLSLLPLTKSLFNFLKFQEE
ncbi:unnamed protein product, partial [Didymodactylos carnosus]